MSKFQKGKWYNNHAGILCYVLRDDNTTFADKLPLVLVWRTPRNPNHDWCWITVNHEGEFEPDTCSMYNLIPGEVDAPKIDVNLPDERAYIHHA